MEKKPLALNGFADLILAEYRYEDKYSDEAYPG
jgi:hypothetical protein